jgi:hypothetical protein
MSMTPALALLGIQGLLGAYDNFRNHEFREGLPHRSGQRRELALHAAREAAYCILFPTMAWLEWRGWLVWLLAAIIVAEIGITCWDFVEEDRTRRLSTNERLLHTVLTLNYGAFLALFAPELLAWSREPAGIVLVDRGLWSWLMSIYSVGVLVFGLREGAAAFRMGCEARTVLARSPHRQATRACALPLALVALQEPAGPRRAQGMADIQLGGFAARQLLRAMGLDMKPGRQPVSVDFQPDGSGELWRRTFATGTFTSRIEADPARGQGLIERFGPFAFHFELLFQRDRIDWRLRQARLFGVPFPCRLLTRITAREWVEEDAGYAMEAVILSPLLGPILRYTCQLEREPTPA